ncbi:EamA-like transporter family protein [Paenibacillus sp. UNC496MF]|uniref:EamA family transporter n=1 Tax=Paenibacillus sp. UNC496MF TaxID=1502753 RepID=UPI0008E5382C|nr:EamA family transporter [Paenibacillus sp. UNC496MF]SFI91651.1 EamA-like transporter family protein [Paenibacillus sp. UNC496MF]
MWFAAAVGSALLFGLAGWWMKVSQMQGGSPAYLFLGLYFAGAAGFAANGAAENSLLAGLADVRVWLAGAIIGAGSALGNALFVKALEYGPASLTSPLTNMNILLVVALGIAAYGEALSAFELAGVILLLAAVALISMKSGGRRQGIRPPWHLYVGLGIALFALRNGGMKVTEEMGLASSPVLFVAYALSFAGFVAFTLRDRTRIRSAGRIGDFVVARRLAASGIGTGLKWGLIAGLFSYAGLQLYALALGTGQASIAGPIFAANSLVVAAGSILLYRERLNAPQWSAFVLLFAGLVLIRL